MSVSLHCNIGPINRTHIGKWKITLQSTYKLELQSYERLRDGTSYRASYNHMECKGMDIH